MTGGGGMTRGAAACSGRVIPVVRDCTQFTGRYGGGVGMFALVVRFDCGDQAAVTRFDELTAAVVHEISEKEPGTLVYATHSVEGAPLARIFYEVYRDRDAFRGPRSGRPRSAVPRPEGSALGWPPGRVPVTGKCHRAGRCMTGKRSILLLHGVQSSQLTWWRLQQDLQDLGWQVQAVDMLGHGSRQADGPGELTIDDLARDVLAQIPGPVNVLAGHSLGSIVALSLVRLAPCYCDRVVIEDPPGLAGPIDLRDFADNVEETVRVTRADPAGSVAALLDENPVWSRRDAENSVKNRLMLDVVRVTRLLRTNRWSLQELVNECPVPVELLVATTDSALTDPDRSLLMDRLPADHVVVIESGHTIHRERPALWLHHVLRFAETSGSDDA